MTDRLAGLVMPDKTPIDETRPLPERPKKAPATAKPAKVVKRSPPPTADDKRSPGDWLIAGTGLALAALCAVFPWYIFFNQDDFGTRPVVFGKASAPAAPEGGGTAVPQIMSARNAMSELPLPNLDMDATGSVPKDGHARTAAPTDQPFPGTKPDFKLVLVANGRAMIRDADGYWVVQSGSWLPDGSRVSSIEQRAGKWVLVTSLDAVVPMQKD